MRTCRPPPISHRTNRTTMKTFTGTNCIWYQPHVNGRACHEDARNCPCAQACTSQTTTQLEYMSESRTRGSYPTLGACNTSIFLTLHPNPLRDVGYLEIHHATHSDSASEIFQWLAFDDIEAVGLDQSSDRYDTETVGGATNHLGQFLLSIDRVFIGPIPHMVSCLVFWPCP